MAGSGVAWWRLLSAGTTVRSLAVLPLMNTAGDEDLEYLCDGIAESLIQQVSKLRSFRVRPLGVVLDFKGPKSDPQAAGRQLGVETVLAGTLERQVERLRISARLVDVATGRQLGPAPTIATPRSCSTSRMRSPARSWTMACACG